MPDFNCKRTVRSFCALLSTGVHAKKFHKVEELFREIPPKLSIDAESRSYTILIRAYCEMGSLDSACSMFDEMEKNEIEPTLFTFKALLEGFYKNNMYVKGEKLWTLMQSRGFAPDAQSYRMRLLGMVFSNQNSGAVKLIEEMALKGFKPDVDFFNALMKGFPLEGKLGEAKHWYEELLKRKCVPDETTYMTLIPFLCEKDNFDMAAQLCSVTLRDKPLIDASILKCVVDGLHGKGKVEEARKLVKLGRTKKLEIDLPLDL
ncbi:hypothetical protein L6164_036487 [Bauhinia variegata]|uniref:Uncharacterized protein n=1 Tax=Bauhinia variegata TaxID=167791 RepID=A0ACB9KH86_BAUVA|nr:hypothetical protein L6164_036487 [Bauhinia variegata]